MSKKFKLIIASGGTGGHFYPTISVAQAFQAAGGEVVLLLSGKHVSEQETIATGYGFQAKAVPSIRLPGKNPVQLLKFPFSLLGCIRQCGKILDDIDGDALLGMGSFAAFPACWSWDYRRKPLIIHEGNSFMGKTNRWLAGRTRHIALSLPLASKHQLKGKPSTLVGMPLRQAILSAAATGKSTWSREEYFARYGLSPEKKTLLVFGGSQGASAINRLLADSAAAIQNICPNLQVLHFSGTDDNHEIQASYDRAALPAAVRRSEPDIEHSYLYSDLVICRAGASSICELALFGKSAILIPLPTAADNHQTVNAETLAKFQAACHLPQSLATTASLSSLLKDWQNAPQVWQNYAANIKQFAKPDAASHLVKIILKTLER